MERFVEKCLKLKVLCMIYGDEDTKTAADLDQILRLGSVPVFAILLCWSECAGCLFVLTDSSYEAYLAEQVQ